MDNILKRMIGCFRKHLSSNQAQEKEIRDRLKMLEKRIERIKALREKY